MDDIEVPQYFICPISLQIMKDPVTVVTGITYDRESIEHWLVAGKNTTCPLTKQTLPKDPDLTPNHTLRRLIQAWCTANASNGVDRIPTPKSPLNKNHVLKLIQDLQVPQLQLITLKKMGVLAAENERNCKCMVESGVAKAMVLLIITCFKKGQTSVLEEALSVLHLIWTPTSETKLLVAENYDLIDSITWVLRCKMDNHVAVKSHAILVLKMIIEVASANLIERLKPEFFKAIVQILRDRISQQATKGALHVLLDSCPSGRNKMKIIDAGAVPELVELELDMPDKRTTELIFGVLDHLCSCADGRDQLLSHAGGIAMVSKRILRVSPAADDRAIHILALICKFSGTNKVLHEMLRVGAVTKLCMVLQADTATYMKEKARDVLRLHSNVWNNSPCIAVYLLTRYRR
ncbi:hypothetical protein HHK36_017986 [Tetracentron sinense]|uniref:U-box domain-containing protein n=1 Tax=Tetracentron sinense TaxID=13715 RepID=A0A834YV36_TETSI|nr:hypothetical protein HHK36_017986 [Tetracentron sinense]